jgi:hypothetical protein
MNAPVVLVNLVDVFVIMRRYTIGGKIVRVVGELVETTGVADKTILLSTLWSYDLGTSSFRESAVSSEYRDRLAQVSGKSPAEVMEEIRLRANILRMLVKKGIKNMEAVTLFCRKYAADADAAIAELGVSRKDLMK